MRAFCELDEKLKRIEVYFSFDPEAKDAVKAIPGARAKWVDEKFKCWTIPKDMQCAKDLRKIFGDDLELGEAVTEWGKAERARTRNLASLAKADDAELTVLPQVAPELYEFLRPFQRADVAFMAETSVMNANDPGLGKTIECIGAVYEAKLDEGPHLVVAPKTALDTVWRFEVERWTDHFVFTYSGEHETDFKHLSYLIHEKEPFWFVTTAAQVRNGLPHGLANLDWNTFIIDEFHKTGATNVSGDPAKGTQFGRAIRAVKRKRLYMVSGTPMGGKPIKLWGALNHLNPEVFTSKWNWAGRWLTVTKNDFGGRDIGGINPDKVDEFYPAHSQYIVRRLKSEVLPQLPPKQHIDVWCDIPKKQLAQYKQFAKDAEIRIDEDRVSALGILAEYTRLKQFANAECKVFDKTIDEEGRPHYRLEPIKSNKLEYLLDRLDERGIRPNKGGMFSEGDEVAVVGSQSKLFVKFLHTALNKAGIATEMITGDTKQADRTKIVERFQKGNNPPRVLVITTTAGGVAITLDRAESVHIMDETWDPDDQTQLEDRVHRISRIHQVTIYRYLSKGTIEEQIRETVGDKQVTNTNIMDVRRQMFRKGE
jgi:SNF2 family DNA or RNA helicase